MARGCTGLANVCKFRSMLTVFILWYDVPGFVPRLRVMLVEFFFFFFLGSIINSLGLSSDPNPRFPRKPATFDLV